MAAVIRATASRVADIGRRHPLFFGIGLSSFKTVASDFVAQVYVEKKERYDFRRSAVFFTWGALYLGGVQYFIYVRLFAQRFFPGAVAFAAKPLREKLADRAGQATVVKQVVLDQFVHHPFVLFPAFYQVKEFVEGGTPRDGFRKFWKNWGEDCRVCWSIWIPAFLINFSCSPLWLRVPFVAVVSFGFTILFSTMRGAREILDTAEGGDARAVDCKGQSLRPISEGGGL
mmetsp:Transcript_104485/g.204933  ORF Transcript_104485/g.204933 Transcript_104485/m.204933 type:complete len:229 (+) Transcript_104485:99-785(+)